MMNQTQRDLLWRLSMRTRPVVFVTVIPDRRRSTIARYRAAMAWLLDHEYVTQPRDLRYLINRRGRRALYHR